MNKIAPDPATTQQLQSAETQIEKRMSAFERSMVRLTRAGVIVATITLAIFIGQLVEMHYAGVDTGRLVTAGKSQAQAAQDFAASATRTEATINRAEQDLGKTASSSESAIKATQDAMRLDQRAWVVFRGIAGIPQVDQPWELDTIFMNTGKTPAINVRVSCNAEIKNTESNLSFKPVANGPPTLIAPNDLGTFCILHPLVRPDSKFSQTDMDIFAHGDLTMFVFGSIVYDDIFNKHHWVTFCRSMHPDGKSWDQCKIHNDNTGDGEYPPK